MSYELERIHQLCLERGWSLYKLALCTNMAPNSIYNLFKRTTIPNVSTLRRICDAFGISLAQFYEADGPTKTLTENQDSFLKLYDLLDEAGKLQARAYICGLLNADPEKAIPIHETSSR